ncbi:MAG: hypothetical protein K0Q72_3688, partial [Armatimonadetes bacterium]|nr:hypothetical protein [Armatimonadota bacterium]
MTRPLFIVRTLRVAASRALVAVVFAALAHAAAAAPTTSKIAFSVSTDPRTSRILIAGADGSGARAITDGKARDRSPAFSPDG